MCPFCDDLGNVSKMKWCWQAREFMECFVPMETECGVIIRWNEQRGLFGRNLLERRPDRKIPLKDALGPNSMAALDFILSSIYSRLLVRFFLWLERIQRTEKGFAGFVWLSSELKIKSTWTPRISMIEKKNYNQTKVFPNYLIVITHRDYVSAIHQFFRLLRMNDTFFSLLNALQWYKFSKKFEYIIGEKNVFNE